MLTPNFSLRVCNHCVAFRVTRQVHVSGLSARVLPYPPSYVFPLPCRLAAFASWTLILPLGVWAFVTIGLLVRSTTGQTPSGLSCSTQLRCDRGGCPLCSEVLVPLMYLTGRCILAIGAWTPMALTYSTPTLSAILRRMIVTKLYVRIRFRSPVRPSPSLYSCDGQLPWA